MGNEIGRKYPIELGTTVGEMEQANLITHGASATLQERLFKSCDPFKSVFCKSCGTISVSNYINKEHTCRVCGGDPRLVGPSGPSTCEFGTCSIPYSFKLLMQTLMGASIRLGIGFDKLTSTRGQIRVGVSRPDEEEEGAPEMTEEQAEIEEIAELAEYYGGEE